MDYRTNQASVEIERNKGISIPILWQFGGF
jgi:hypothetical protein